MQQNSEQPSQRTNLDSHLSMVTARNRLKQVQDKIYEARHRLDKLHKKSEKNEHQNMYKTKVNGFREHIREFANQQRSMKIENKLRKSFEVNNYHELNLDRRSQHKQKIKQMKQMIQTQNRWVYQNIRKQKQKNQKLIQKQKSKQHENKRKRRDQLIADQQRRSAYLKQFLKNKHLTAKQAKDRETEQIQAQIIQRQKLLAHLQRKNSEMSMNPELTSRSRSNEGNDSRVSKGFRISSSKKKQGKELIQ